MSALAPISLVTGLFLAVCNNASAYFFGGTVLAFALALGFMFSKCPGCGRQIMKRKYVPGKFQISNWYLLYPKQCNECSHNHQLSA